MLAASGFNSVGLSDEELAAALQAEDEHYARRSEPCHLAAGGGGAPQAHVDDDAALAAAIAASISMEAATQPAMPPAFKAVVESAHAVYRAYYERHQSVDVHTANAECLRGAYAESAPHMTAQEYLSWSLSENTATSGGCFPGIAGRLVRDYLELLYALRDMR